MLILIQGRNSANLDQNATIAHKNTEKSSNMMLRMEMILGKDHGVEDRTIGADKRQLQEARTEIENFSFAKKIEST